MVGGRPHHEGGGHRTGDEPVNGESKEPRARRLSTRSQLLDQQRRWAVSTGLTVEKLEQLTAPARQSASLATSCHGSFV